jgi:hypothetical protein
MTNQKLANLTDDELVTSFEGWARARVKAVIDCDATAATHSYRKLDAVDRELRTRGLRARGKLLVLLDHPELPVRYYAAKRLLALEPDRARSIIEDTKAGPFDSLALDAGMTLRALDEGIFKPT